MPTEDLDVYNLMGKRGSEITGYPSVSVYHGFRYHPKAVMHGAMDDFGYDHHGWFGFTPELWDLPTTAGVEQPRDFIKWIRWHPEEDDLKLMRWNDEVMNGEAFIDWPPFEHPQLGPVEIGGWNSKLYRDNAPLTYLPEMCEKQSRWTLAMASLCPYLTIPYLTVESQGQGLSRIIVVVDNGGFLPTYTSRKALERKAVRPIEVELTLARGVEIVTGARWQEVGHLEGRSNKIWNWWAAGSPTDNRLKLEWVVRGPAGAQLNLTVRAQRAGTLCREIRLEA
jgi:murein tripeptide amidase MpaA